MCLCVFFDLKDINLDTNCMKIGYLVILLQFQVILQCTGSRLAAILNFGFQLIFPKRLRGAPLLILISTFKLCKKQLSKLGSVKMVTGPSYAPLLQLQQLRPSVRLSVCLSHAGILSKRLHVARCSLHCQIAKCVQFCRNQKYSPGTTPSP